MQIKRIKAHKRIMRIYTTHFGFFPPLHVIVDESFLHAALQHRLNLNDLFTQHFGYPVTLFTTSCILETLRKLGPDYLGTLLAAQRFTHRKCTHPPVPHCLMSHHPFCVLATNSNEVRRWVRRQVGVPCVTLRQGGVLVVDKPTAVQAPEPAVPASTVTASRKRKRKQPNPLSIKKKKPKQASTSLVNVSSTKSQASKKRKRKHPKRKKTIEAGTGSGAAVSSTHEAGTKMAKINI